MDPERVEQATTRIGTALDRWTVDSLLGIGGMAAVYSASAGDERVAIKVLHPDLTRSQRALDRFQREGDVLAAAKHAAVPRVRGKGETSDGCPFFVMDLLLGETVEARRRRFGGRLAPGEVVQIALVVLDVLDAVHSRGILHRDIKPSNVLWLDDGEIRLIDFGIAKMERADEQVTRTGTLPGSLAFMSPEHALGVPSEIDARSDLWSLGAMMFLLLSGRPVHESQTEVEALARSASRPARSLGTVERGLPQGLITVVDRALAFDRKMRFPDASAMRVALLGGDEPRAKPQRRRYGLMLAFGAVCLAGVVMWTGEQRIEGKASPRIAVSLSPRALVVAAPNASELREPGPPPDVRPSSRAPVRVVVQPDASAEVPSAAPASSASRCDPPFVIDPATGTRRVKPGC